MMMARNFHSFLYLMGALMMVGPSASAAAETENASSAFNISPLRLELASDEQSTKMLVRNASTKALAVQVRVFSWEQKDGKDIYAPSQDVSVSPSIMKIDAQRTQTFHIIDRKSSKIPGERRYRIVVDELPNKSKVAAGMAKTRLRMTLPLFINSQSATAANLTYGITPNGLIIKNSGGQTARLSALVLKNFDGSLEKLTTKGPRYVMGGSEILIELPAKHICGNDGTTISGIVDKEKFDAIPAQNCS